MYPQNVPTKCIHKSYQQNVSTNHTNLQYQQNWFIIIYWVNGMLTDMADHGTMGGAPEAIIN